MTRGPLRLIATDLDGTLLRGDKTISARTSTALRRAVEAGMIVVAATGRQPGGLPGSLTECGVGYVVGANGAIGVERASRRVLFEEPIPAEVVNSLVATVRELMPQARLSVARQHGEYYLYEPGYRDLILAHEQVPESYLRPGLEADLTAEATLKLSVRDPGLSAEEMLATLSAATVPGVHATTSGAPFLEISVAGVTKATGLQRLCDALSISSAEVIAFGDAGNDAEMLAWAGRGVAMGNATPAVREIADEVTATNDADGLAIVVEAILNEGNPSWNR